MSQDIAQHDTAQNAETYEVIADTLASQIIAIFTSCESDAANAVGRATVSNRW